MRQARKHLEQGFKILSELEPKDRMRVYKSLRDGGSLASNPNAPGVFNSEIATEALRINAQGRIEVIKKALGEDASQPSVFMSHSHVDRNKVRRIASRLSNSGIKVWMDEAEINHGDSLIEKLSAALHQVDMVLAFLSEASINSEWVKKELEIAMTREIRNRRVTAVPVLLEEVDLPQFLDGKLYADFTTSYRRRKEFPKLISSILAHKIQKPEFRK